MTIQRTPLTPIIAALLATVTLALTACGDDAEDSDVGPETIEVTMADFSYGGIPDSIALGTRIAVSNVSGGELHEFVAFRLDDDDDRPGAEIMSGDIGALLGGAEPAMVLIAPPGSADQIVPVGEPIFDEEGRYLILCAIPTGADPDEYLAAAATGDGPPQVDGGPPHFMEGMFAVVEVTT